MPTRSDATVIASEKRLTAAVRDLQKTIETLPMEHGIAFHPAKHLLFTYAKGIAYGLGALSAVAIVVPILVAMLQRVAWVPLAGDFVQKVSERIENARRE